MLYFSPDGHMFHDLSSDWYPDLDISERVKSILEMVDRGEIEGLAPGARAVKPGASADTLWESRSTDHLQYPDGLFEPTKIRVAKGIPTPAAGADAEVAAIHAADEVTGFQSVNTRRAVSEYEHRGASGSNGQSIYINLVKQDVATTKESFDAAWAAHRLANPHLYEHTARLNGTDAYTQGTTKYHTGTDAYTQGTTKYHTGTSKFHTGTSKHHTGTSKHHTGTSKWQTGTSKFHTGTSKHDTGTAEPMGGARNFTGRGKSTFSNGDKGDKQALSVLLANFSQEELKPLFMGKTASALQTAIAKKSVQGATLKACGAMAQSRYTRVKVLFEKRK